MIKTKTSSVFMGHLPIELSHVYLSYIIAFGLVIFLVATVAISIRGTKHIRSFFSLKESIGFFDIITDHNKNPSLALFQFLIWTLVIGFAFSTVYLIRILGGVYEAPSGEIIPQNLIILMGISTISPILDVSITKKRKNNESMTKDKNGESRGILPKGHEPDIIKSKKKQFKDLFLEEGKPSFQKFQMFFFAMIGVFLFTYGVFGATMDQGSFPLVPEGVDLNDPRIQSKLQTQYEIQLKRLSVPDVDPLLTIVIGGSQGAFLTTQYQISKSGGGTNLINTLRKMLISKKLTIDEYKKLKELFEKENEESEDRNS